MEVLTLFAGWGACGALNNAGVTELYFITTIAQGIAMAIVLALLIIAHNTVKPFDARGYARPAYLVVNVICACLLLLVLYSSGTVAKDHLFGDNNLSRSFEGRVPCDPITQSILTQATVTALFGVALVFLQVSMYRKKWREWRKAHKK